MRKIFGILVVLMMVAGTFVSCSRPTDVSTGAGTSVSGSIIKESPDGALCIVRDERGEVFFCTKAASVFEGYYANTTFKPVNIVNAPTDVPTVFKKLYMTESEWNGTDDGAFNNGICSIKSSVLSPSTNIQTFEYEGYSFKYEIQQK